MNPLSEIRKSIVLTPVIYLYVKTKGRLSESVVAVGVGRPSGLPGSVAQAGTVRVHAGRQVCRANPEIFSLSHFARTPAACEKK